MRKSKKNEQKKRVLMSTFALIAVGSILVACAAAPDQGTTTSDAVALEQARVAADAANARLALAERQARQATADAQVRLRVTEDALRMAQQSEALDATRTANSQVAQATAIALDNIAAQQRAQVAATAQAADIALQATSMSINATSTAISISQDNARRTAQWERDVLIPAKTFIMAGAGIAVAVVVLYLLVRFGFKMVDTWVLHARVFRDGRGNITIVTEPGKGGEMEYVQPHLSPAPVLSISRRGQSGATIEASGGDPEVTRRAQLVDTLQLATPRHTSTQPRLTPRVPTGNAAATGEHALPQLIEPAIATAQAGFHALLGEPRVNVVTSAQVPAQIADGNALAALDADWRTHNA